MDDGVTGIPGGEAAEAVAGPRRVLLVEDSSVTTDIVTLVLGQAGHDVTCAADGAAALECLRTLAFDVVLMDFHLPDITGLEVVRRFRDGRDGAPMPQFIAITGDVRGLLLDSRNCEVFDRVVPKPLDIDAVCELVESPVPSHPAAPARGVETPLGAEAGNLPFAWLRWPMADRASLSPGLVGIDAILVTEAVDLAGLWSVPGAHLLPVVDRTGTLGAMADFDLSRLMVGDVDRLTDLVDAFHRRRSDLHADFLRGGDDADRLLARMHVSGGALEPERDGARKPMIAWSTLAPDGVIDAALTRLAGDELAELRFFERIHQCPACASARLITREECPSCGSAHLKEESYLHHFRCAYQGVESEFTQGAELVCPKCRRRLAHFGNDYDRPGHLVHCRACRSSTSEPSVGFVCADCSAHCATDAAPVRDVMSATITDRGTAYLRTGHSGLGRRSAMFRFSDLPIDMIVAMNRAASTWNEDQTPFVLVRITHDALFELRETHGLRQVAEARRLWLGSLRQALGGDVPCAAGSNDDYVLLPGQSPDTAAARLMRPRAAAAADIRFDLQSAVQVFGPEDLAR